MEQSGCFWYCTKENNNFSLQKELYGLHLQLRKTECLAKAIALVKTISACTQTFPKEERFGITGQIRRASLSIPTNIAEGVSRKTPRDQAHFSTIAYGSLTETLNLLIIAQELGYLPSDQYNHCRSQIEETSKLLTALRKSQQS